ESLVSLLRQAGHCSESKVVAIVDWADEIRSVPWPYLRMMDNLTAAGLEVVVVAAEDLEYVSGSLFGAGVKIGTVFRGITPGARVHSEWPSLRPLLRAWQEGTVCLVSDWWAPFFSSKRVLALLSEALGEAR